MFHSLLPPGKVGGEMSGLSHQLNTWLLKWECVGSVRRSPVWPEHGELSEMGWELWPERWSSCQLRNCGCGLWKTRGQRVSSLGKTFSWALYFVPSYLLPWVFRRLPGAEVLDLVQWSAWETFLRLLIVILKQLQQINRKPKSREMNSPWFVQKRWHIGSIIIQKLMLFILGMGGAGACWKRNGLKTYLQPVKRQETRGKLLEYLSRNHREPQGHTVRYQRKGLCLVFPWGVQSEVFPIISVGLKCYPLIKTSNKD